MIMKFSLAALVVACAVASPAFAAFDIPPFVPPHLAALATVSETTFDIPPFLPPHVAAVQQNA
jgi:hypothetical protein